MQCALGFAALVLSIGGADAAALRSKQEPDTSCGKGFDNLVKGSQDYYRTAAVELWTHPSHTMDNATFEDEFECWFASMCSTKCGGLPSRADSRKKQLTEKCLSEKADWLQVWNMFTQDEIKYFKADYPAAPAEEGAEETVDDSAAESPIHYKQAMESPIHY